MSDDRSVLEAADAEFLIRSGLLFEVNRRVLHPLGLALTVEGGDDCPTRISPRLERAGVPEGLVYAPADLADGFRRYLAWMKDVGFQRLARRYRRLGYRAQVEPDVDPGADDRDWSPPAAELAERARAVITAAREVTSLFVEYADQNGAEIEEVTTVEIVRLNKALDRYDGEDGPGGRN